MSAPTAPFEVSLLLSDPAQGSRWLQSLGVHDGDRAQKNLVSLYDAGLPHELFVTLCGYLREELPRLSDPDRALNNLDRFMQASRSPISLAALFERDRRALTELLQIFSISQHQSELLIADPSTFDRLRLNDGATSLREELVDELLNEVRCFHNEKSANRLLQAFKQREMARIAYGDLIRGQRLDVVTRQLSYLAESVCEAAIWLARAQLDPRFGTPRTPQGQPCQFVILGLGKLGGVELNYSSDIDLVMLYEDEGQCDGDRPITNAEYFQRLARAILRLLTESTDYGVLYRVDLRLRPDGKQGPIAISEPSARQYYETKGRTWERQAWLKARPVAGDRELGRRFLAWLEPWIYRKVVSHGDIQDIRALKRQIERKAIRAGTEQHDVKIGTGGIRDVEFVIQFLQLLNGGEIETIRTGNTLEAISRLEMARCLTRQETRILEDNYLFLRKVEHFLQIMFDRQIHELPSDENERRKLAIRMGFVSEKERTPLLQFDQALTDARRLNRKILDHLLHDALSAEEPVLPEVDLILMADPAPELVNRLMESYGFHDPEKAYTELMSLASEEIRFLSDARCRRFLAAIAQPLLAAIAQTPDPDATLLQLSQVSSSLGGKGVLWELFRSSPASLKLYVQLCAAAPYLAGILTSSPGMIDELMDSLVLGRLPSTEHIEANLDELCRGAEDIEPILHGFKNSMHLRVGVRDVLGKDDIKATTAALADIAEACLHQTVHHEFRKLAWKFGTPRLDPGAMLPSEEELGLARPAGTAEPLNGNPTTDTRGIGLELDEDECDFVILGMGKLGGREPNYHSDLDVVFLYQTDGATCHRGRIPRGLTTSNHHFFSELSQRVIRAVSRTGPFGRLYEMDPRLRPAGRSGTMAVSFEEFRRYFADGRGQLWERLALCKARPVFGSHLAREQAMIEVGRVLREPPWEAHFASEIYQMRMQLEETASRQNLKRGPGGTVDVEFLVQFLQLRHAADTPQVLTTGTLDAIIVLHQCGYLPREDADYLDESYRFMRSVEARIRLMNYPGRHELPDQPADRAKLAYLLGFADGDHVAERCRDYMRRNRELMRRYFQVPLDP